MMDRVSHRGYIKHEVPMNIKSVAAAERYGRGAWRPPEQIRTTSLPCSNRWVDLCNTEHQGAGNTEQGERQRKTHNTAKAYNHFLVFVVGELLRKKFTSALAEKIVGEPKTVADLICIALAWGHILLRNELITEILRKKIQILD
jgi:hypothetical protein